MAKLMLEGTVTGIETFQSKKSGKTYYTILIKDDGSASDSDGIPVTYFNDDASSIEEGDEVVAYCKLKGNEYNGRHYVALTANDIEVKDKVVKAPAGRMKRVEYKDVLARKVGDGDDDIPF